MTTVSPIDELCINTIRFLAVDAVEKANTGHPGTPLGAAPMAYVLWDRFLKHNPADPKWMDRDRFVLSCGHASAMLYALLHLTGYDMPLDEIKQFRQWGSRTPGHPEYGIPGVETTTGPLGQGFANGVGMAIAERWLAEHYNRPGHEIVSHYTYAIVSDGDLQEGVASEAASLAGTLRLGKLIYLYDDNDISIEGNTSIAFAENVAQRFQAYGWHVVEPVDGMDLRSVDSSIRLAQAETGRPSLIICRTIIGYGSPSKAGTAAAHGEPLGAEETRLTKQALGWDYPEPFMVPPEALSHFRQALERGGRLQREWQAKLDAYRQAYPDDARQLEEDLNGNLPAGWDANLSSLFESDEKPIATREASGRVMNAISRKVHSFTGGSADLAPSTRTMLKDHGDYGFDEYYGHNMHFGVREHAMGAIANGMSLHGGIIPYTGTFLVFYDYMRPPVRLAAMMGIRVVYIFTHDSVGLGEDGPTHQPVEQLAGLRSVPGLVTIRPGDAHETVEAWKAAVSRRDGPTALVLSRQKMPVLDRTTLASAAGVQRGGYVLWEAGPSPQAIVIGTGSEVHLALEAGHKLQEMGVSARVVSMPSWEMFDAQPEEYRHEVLPPDVSARVAIEAASPLGWERYVGLAGSIIAVNRFGASAPAETIYEKLGLDAAHVADEVIKLLAPENIHPGTSLGDYLPDIEAALADLDRHDVVARIWQKDHTVWKPDPREITNRLGWLTVTEQASEQVPELKAFAREVRDAGLRHVVLAGMGGSSLGPEVLRQTFGSAPGYPELIVLEAGACIVPAHALGVSGAIEPLDTMFLISSKSGGTIEPLSLLHYFLDIVTSATGKDAGGKNFVAITDSESPLVTEAQQAGFDRVFLNPPDIGGRYSVLSGFGMVPAALMGIDIGTLLERAGQMKERCASSVPAHENHGAWLGACIGTLAMKGRDKLTLVTSPGIASFGLWVEQLLAESTGKEGRGIIPVVGEPLMDPTDYGDDRVFVYLRLHDDDNSDVDAAIERLMSAGQPLLTLELRDRYDLGAEFFRWEFATAVAGAILGIDPFDQPNVQQAKDATTNVLNEYVSTGNLPPAETVGSLDDLLSEAGPGKYLAIMAYVCQSQELDAALTEFRRQLVRRYHIATTLGYGPRFLHSTGQLHKGGPDSGLFLQLTASHEDDQPVPGKPYTLGTVADAQVLGDLRALQSLGRRVVRIHFDRSDGAGIPALVRGLLTDGS